MSVLVYFTILFVNFVVFAIGENDLQSSSAGIRLSHISVSLPCVPESSPHAISKVGFSLTASLPSNAIKPGKKESAFEWSMKSTRRVKQDAQISILEFGGIGDAIQSYDFYEESKRISTSVKCSELKKWTFSEDDPRILQVGSAMAHIWVKSRVDSVIPKMIDQVSCGIHIAEIHSLQVIYASKEVFVGDELELYVLAKDAQGNTFTSLEGLSFEWYLTDKNSTTQSVLQPIKFSQSKFKAPESLRTLERGGFSTNVLISKAEKTGNSSVKVSFCPNGRESCIFSSSIDISVRDRIIFPFESAAVFPNGVFKIQVYREIQRERIIARFLTESYKAYSSNVSVVTNAQINEDGELTFNTGNLIGTSEISIVFGKEDVCASLRVVVIPPNFTLKVETTDSYEEIEGMAEANYEPKHLIELVHDKKHRLSITCDLQEENLVWPEKFLDLIDIQWTPANSVLFEKQLQIGDYLDFRLGYALFYKDRNHAFRLSLAYATYNFQFDFNISSPLQVSQRLLKLPCGPDFKNSVVFKGLHVLNHLPTVWSLSRDLSLSIESDDKQNGRANLLGSGSCTPGYISIQQKNSHDNKIQVPVQLSEPYSLTLLPSKLDIRIGDIVEISLSITDHKGQEFSQMWDGINLQLELSNKKMGKVLNVSKSDVCTDLYGDLHRSCVVVKIFPTHVGVFDVEVKARQGALNLEQKIRIISRYYQISLPDRIQLSQGSYINLAPSFPHSNYTLDMSEVIDSLSCNWTLPQSKLGIKINGNTSPFSVRALTLHVQAPRNSTGSVLLSMKCYYRTHISMRNSVSDPIIAISSDILVLVAPKFESKSFLVPVSSVFHIPDGGQTSCILDHPILKKTVLNNCSILSRIPFIGSVDLIVDGFDEKLYGKVGIEVAYPEKLGFEMVTSRSGHVYQIQFFLSDSFGRRFDVSVGPVKYSFKSASNAARVMQSANIKNGLDLQLLRKVPEFIIQIISSKFPDVAPLYISSESLMTYPISTYDENLQTTLDETQSWTELSTSILVVGVGMLVVGTIATSCLGISLF
jgi:hypothetical protein